jgi:peptidoglycan/xylan/chitin deacetylase (PgdA/CDA1 family)
LLLAYDVTATVFVTTGLVDRDDGVVRRFGALWGAGDEAVRGMTWSQVAEMRAAGVQIGAHTLTHPNLATMSGPAAFEEMTRSKDVIETHLGIPVETFAYPFGRPRHHVSAATIGLAGRSGFGSAATIVYRGAGPTENPMAIPRFPITRDPVEVLAGKVGGALDAIGLWQERSPLWLSRLVSSDPSEPRSVSGGRAG